MALKEIARLDGAATPGSRARSRRGGGLGAPPLINNALRVYVTNINELTAGGGRGLGGVIEGVSAASGASSGGLLGSFAGGAVGVIAQPFELEADRAHRRHDRAADAGDPPIVDAVAVIRSGPPDPAAKRRPEPAAGHERSSTTALARRAGAPPPARPSAGSRSCARSAIASTASIVLVPLLVGAFAAFLVRLSDVQSAIVSLLTFAVETALVLRGLVLVTIFDTVAVAARLAANVLRIVADAVDSSWARSRRGQPAA